MAFSLPSSPDHQQFTNITSPFSQLWVDPLPPRLPNHFTGTSDQCAHCARCNGIHTHIVPSKPQTRSLTQPPLSKSEHIPATSYNPQGQVCPAIKARHSCRPASSFHLSFPIRDLDLFKLQVLTPSPTFPPRSLLFCCRIGTSSNPPCGLWSFCSICGTKGGGFYFWSIIYYPRPCSLVRTIL